MLARTKGFTLVELSIVLVIIGLLIGGILVGQSMVSTARVNAQVSQLQQLDAAVMNFRTKYNGLPGDSRSFGGDGNGVITLGCCGEFTANFGGEIANFWNNINPEQFPNTYAMGATVKAVLSGVGQNVPIARFGAANSFLRATALSIDGGHADTTNPMNVYAVLNGTQLQSPISSQYRIALITASNSAVKPADLLALDTKIDDGFANNGNVRSGGAPVSAGAGSGAIMYTPYNGICSSGQSYLLSTSYECTPVIGIGAQAGNLQ